MLNESSYFLCYLSYTPTGDYEEIMNKVSCLSILSNAVLIWNTIEIGKIIEQLRSGGEEIRDEEIAGVSPLIFRHIIPSGTYHFREVVEGDTIALNTLE
ncbi:MAG TPA: Tn3 family transposase [Pyrinomonadaceae bacterium]|nr:Tn3 family transposase [Pyrinomonadaceae bacterium]